MAYLAETHVAIVDPRQPDPHTMVLAGQAIVDGGLVAFPTETVYGLGANALDADAVRNIFEAKDRPANDPVIVHIHDLSQLALVAEDIPDHAFQLADAFWPGPLTLVLKRSARISDVVTAGQDTVAVRMPSHPVALALIRKAGVPIAAPSANRFSRPSPTSAEHVIQDLDGRVDIILDGGKTHIGLESSIVDLTGHVPVLLRPGGISLEALQEHLPALAFRPRHILDEEIAPAPGTLMKHYSPNAEVVVFHGAGEAVWQAMRERAGECAHAGETVGIMLMDADIVHFEGVEARFALLGASDEAIASSLFAAMRELDTAQVQTILVRAPEQRGLGLAIYDRLKRAAEGRIIAINSGSEATDQQDE